MEEPIVPQPLLHNCGGAFSATDKFCPSCGQVIGHEAQPKVNNTGWLIYVLLYYGFCLAVFLGNQYGHLVEDLDDFYALEIADAIITVVFAFFGLRELVRLYSFKNVSIPRLLLYIPITVAASTAINFVVTKMNWELFNTTMEYESLFATTDNPLLYSLLLIAVYPALFEEMAFRGFLYNGLKNISGENNAVYITSVLFTIVHFSILSIFWLLPFAIILANLRRKHNTLWYGMVIHFVFNATACLIEHLGLFTPNV